MVRLIVLAVAAFLLAMGGATGVLVLHHRSTAVVPEVTLAGNPGEARIVAVTPAEPVAEGDHHPSADEDDSADEGAAETPADSRPESDSVPAPPPLVADGGATNGGVAPASSSITPVADTTTAPLPERRLAKIFGSMQPREAARVLEQMDDHDVVAIMGMMNDRQAAAVLANLPPQRAAGISRLGSQTGRNTP